MPKVTAAVAALLLAFTLTGCGDDTTPAESNEARGFADTAPADETATPTPAETLSAPPSDEVEVAYVAYVRGKLLANTQIPDATDEQLIDAGRRACDILDSGTNPDDLTVIDGEERAGGEGGYFQDSATIATGARMYLCAP